MYNLLAINLEKRLSKLSLLFLSFSLLFLWSICFYYADPSVNDACLKWHFERIFSDFYFESLEIIILVGILLTVLLSEMELFGHGFSFDAYFACRYGKIKFAFAKIFAYLFIIFMFVTYLFFGVTIIYLYRFKNLIYLSKIFEAYIYLLIYLDSLFLFTFDLVLLLQNYFVAFITIIMYWLSKLSIAPNINRLIGILFLNIGFDYKSLSIGFTASKEYCIIYLIILFGLGVYIYTKKDFKC